jgi:hypothetical protein
MKSSMSDLVLSAASDNLRYLIRLFVYASTDESKAAANLSTAVYVL